MANPQIIYVAAGGTITLQFTHPPSGLPAYYMDAVRHDNIASSGVRESIIERIDNFLEVNMRTVLSGSDVQNWSFFMASALQGNPFSYYPDSTLAAFTNYTLEDTTWDAAWRTPGVYTFKMKLRQVVT